jgi:hypothetical protein
MNRKHPDAQFKAGNQQFIIFLGSEHFNCICCQIKLFFCMQLVELRFCPCPCFILSYLQSLWFKTVFILSMLQTPLFTDHAPYCCPWFKITQGRMHLFLFWWIPYMLHRLQEMVTVPICLTMRFVRLR